MMRSVVMRVMSVIMWARPVEPGKWAIVVGHWRPVKARMIVHVMHVVRVVTMRRTMHVMRWTMRARVVTMRAWVVRVVRISNWIAFCAVRISNQIVFCTVGISNWIAFYFDRWRRWGIWGRLFLFPCWS